MFTAFSTALSGMAANSAAVDVISNNLANLNTAGFKATSAQFQDMMAQSLGGGNADVGMGVGPVATTRIFTQGSVQTNGAPTNAAIQGPGFFVVKDQNNQTLFTRAGNFEIDQSGNLITLSGEKVQGWTAVGGVINPNGPTSSITIPGGAIIPGNPTTKMSMGLNLDATAVTGAASGTFAAPISVVDSLGVKHVLTATFTKTGANAWSYAVTIPQADLATGGSAQIATGNLTFDATGKLTSPAATAAPVSLDVKGLADQAQDMTIAWSLFDSAGNPLITQLAQTSAISSADQDGVAPGQVVDVAIKDGGFVVANYSNGLHATVAQLALAAIRNPESLASAGNNNLIATVGTAAPVIGSPDTGGRGKIVGGALEASTADIAKEFTNLIVVQRSYQANSKVVTASDTLLQETVNLIR